MNLINKTCSSSGQIAKCTDFPNFPNSFSSTRVDQQMLNKTNCNSFPAPSGRNQKETQPTLAGAWIALATTFPQNAGQE